jgi:hypothetical protein
MVIQPEPTTAQLSFENPVLFSKERDHIALFSLQPAEQHRDDQVQRKDDPKSTPTVAAIPQGRRSGWTEF